MVRQSKQTPEQRKDTHKKKTQPQDKYSPGKPSDSTTWLCRMSGCNKQFAREADLKRHQRTTKLHSVPGFACPQCDARFTRTDALRRHQKSRHNGVVIEPTYGTDNRRSMGDEDPRSSGSRSRSRSETPPLNGTVPPSTVSPGSSQSYYRQHTFTSGVMVDGHYSPSLPTSSTRLHQATWQSTPPWAADGSQPSPHMIHPGYTHPYYNAQQQYYRPMPDVVSQSLVQNGVSSSSNGESSSSRKSSPSMAVDPSLEDPSEIGDAETMIDPSLVSPSASSGENGEPSTDGRIRKAGPSSNSGQCISSPDSSEPSNSKGNNANSETTIGQALLSPNRDHPYPSHSVPLDHPLEMEQILTEDGEPMLNPAELLTQESLASPPPS